MKIPESKRSKIGKIVEFHGILNGFPNLAAKDMTTINKQQLWWWRGNNGAATNSKQQSTNAQHAQRQTSNNGRMR
jgi:hypothetical protein